MFYTFNFYFLFFFPPRLSFSRPFHYNFRIRSRKILPTSLVYFPLTINLPFYSILFSVSPYFASFFLLFPPTHALHSFAITATVPPNEGTLIKMHDFMRLPNVSMKIALGADFFRQKTSACRRLIPKHLPLSPKLYNTLSTYPFFSIFFFFLKRGFAQENETACQHENRNTALD